MAKTGSRTLRNDVAQANREEAEARRAAQAAKKAALAPAAGAAWDTAEVPGTPPPAPLTGRQRKRKRSTRSAPPKVMTSLVDQLVTVAAQQQGDYREVKIAGASIVQGGKEKVTTRVVVRNLGGSPVDRWLTEGGPGYDEPQRRAIDYCRALWLAAATTPSMVANFDRVRGSGRGDGIAQQNALTELSGFKRQLPARYWDVFENVVRWEEPAGTAGSSFARNTAQSIASAKTIVGFVASMIAQWCRF